MRTGQKVMTRRIAERIAENEKFAKQVTYFFGLYLQKDWGDISDGDAELNDFHVQSGTGSLMGSYETCEARKSGL